MMPLSIFKNKDCVIGLDIGAFSIKASQFIEKENRLYLTGVKAVEITKDKDVRQALKEVLSGMPFKKARIITLVNSPHSMLKRVVIPPMPPEELNQAIHLEAKNYFPFSVEDSLIDFEITGEVIDNGVRKNELLVAVCPNKIISERLALLAEIGLGPYQVIHPGLALANLLRLRKFKDSIGLAALDLGKQGSELIIIRNEKLVFNRKIPVSGDDFTQALTSVLFSNVGKIQLSYEEAERIKTQYGILQENSQELIENKITPVQLFSLLRSPAEKLSNEIERSFDFYREETKGSRVERLILFGGGSQLKGLDKFLGQALGLEVEVYRSLEGIGLREGRDTQGLEPGRIALAAGAALNKAGGINLVPDQIKQETQRLIEKVTLKAIISALITFLALYFIGMRIQATSLEKKISAVSSELSSLKSSFGEAKDWLLLNKTISNEPYWGDALKEISNTIPAQVYLKEINVQAGVVILKGNSLAPKNSEEMLATFIRKLESGMFKNVRFISIQDGSPIGKEFELQMEVE